MTTIDEVLEKARRGDESARHAATVLGHSLGAEARRTLFSDVERLLGEYHETVQVRRQEYERAGRRTPAHRRDA